MSKTFTSERVVVLGGDDPKKPVKRSFGHVAENVDDEKLIAFGKIVAEITGDALIAINVTDVHQVKEDPAA
ncbi:hypothetical protein L1O48_05665 [Ligilactobacillus equi]|uniref:DUF1659 domain-containing protein n=1 Tax=Ligilactobacillus equi TaxID=137357 RepID=UPI002ED3EDBE